MKKFITATFLITCFFCHAQIEGEVSSIKLSKRTNSANKTISWYESPKESSGDTIVYRLYKYVSETGDDPTFAYSNLVFKDATYFSVEYWRWSTKTAGANFGTWSNPEPTTILLDFGPQKSKCNLSILEATDDKLKVFIKEQ